MVIVEMMNQQILFIMDFKDQFTMFHLMHLVIKLFHLKIYHDKFSYFLKWQYHTLNFLSVILIISKNFLLKVFVILCYFTLKYMLMINICLPCIVQLNTLHFVKFLYCITIFSHIYITLTFYFFFKPT